LNTKSEISILNLFKFQNELKKNCKTYIFKQETLTKSSLYEAMLCVSNLKSLFTDKPRA